MHTSPQPPRLRLEAGKGKDFFFLKGFLFQIRPEFLGFHCSARWQIQGLGQGSGWYRVGQAKCSNSILSILSGAGGLAQDPRQDSGPDPRLTADSAMSSCLSQIKDKTRKKR